MNTNNYDVIVIGAGPGGLAAAYQLASTKKVLVVEQKLWGGTCPNYGCDPKKMLYGAVEAQRQAQTFNQHGVAGTEQLQIDWPALMAHKRSYTERVPAGTEQGLAATEIDHVYGSCEFIDAHTVRVNEERYTAAAIVIATGATPTIPDIQGNEWLQTSTDFLNLDQLPKRIGFIGAGYVAIELANIAVSAGAEVHIFQHNTRILRAFPQQVTEQLTQILSNKGIHFHFNTEIKAVDKLADQSLVVTDQHATNYQFDAIFAASGRRPNIDALHLSASGITANAQGIPVNDHLRTVQPHIFAIGDVASKAVPKLTPVASFEGRYVASQILTSTQPAIEYPVIPHTVFAGPELSQVGLSIEIAKQAPKRYQILQQDVGNWYTYHRILDHSAQVTTIIDRTTQTLVGAVVLATNAEELINAFTVMIQQHTTQDMLQHFIPVYPSTASDLGYFM